MNMEDHAAAPADLEYGQPTKPQKLYPSVGPYAAQEAAALLTIWSLLVINEGAIRLINSNPAAGLSGGRPSNAVVFLGGLVEVIFGLIGLFVGAAAFVLRKHNASVTKLAMVVQTILGYYVFVVYVFVIPAFRATDLVEPSLEGLSLGQSKFLIALGVLTSFHFCLALQGGQFVFMARLVTATTGQDFLKQKSGARMRAAFWNGNLGMSGMWTLITGILIAANVGSGKLEVPFESPPNVGLLPVMTIVTGAVMMVWAVTGIVIAQKRMGVPSLYFPVTGLVYLLAFGNFTIVQFGLLDGAPAGAVALHAGLVFMVTFLGPYFVNLAAKEEVGEE